MNVKKHQIPAPDHLDAREFVIAVKRLADSLSYGSDSSPFLGTGSEYVQSRIYQPGDPVKLIDWRITARLESPGCMNRREPILGSGV